MILIDKIMRTIKFRVWNEINKMLYPDGNGYFDDGKTFVIDGLGELIYLDNYNTPKGILMQFTGLLDKNGVEIYDQDILDNGKLVYWSDEQACHFCGDTPLCMSNSHRAIIGNLHEHKHLLV